MERIIMRKMEQIRDIATDILQQQQLTAIIQKKGYNRGIEI